MSQPMYFPNAPFDLSEALVCSRLVDTAYDMYSQWVAQGKPKQADFRWKPKSRLDLTFGEPLWGNDPAFWVLDRSEPFAFCAWSRNAEIWLVIRGTESAEDWAADISADLTDYNLAPNYGRAHAGFYKIYASMSGTVRSALGHAMAQVGSPEAIFLGAHSLGSALSTLAVPDILANTAADQHAMRIKHYNLASPRAGDADFAAAYDANGVATYRVVNSCDLVPEVPPAIIGDELFEHVGVPVDFSAQYRSLGGNHSAVHSYGYALIHPQQPQGPMPASG